jgi:hypothetical protein
MSDNKGPGVGPDAVSDDQVFLDLKAAIATSDPVPVHVIDAALASRTWRRVDAELAELVYDSLLEAALVRDGAGARQLTFESPELTVEVEVGVAALDGQLVPPQPANVVVRHRGGSVTVAADHLGHFHVDGVPHGPLSLRCVSHVSGVAIATSWVVI